MRKRTMIKLTSKIKLVSKLLKKSDDTKSRTDIQIEKMCAFLEKKGFRRYDGDLFAGGQNGGRTSKYDPHYYEASEDAKVAGIAEIVVEAKTSSLYDPENPEESEWYPKWSAYDHKGKCLQTAREGLSSLVVYYHSVMENR
jgi:hypothetical protein